MGGNIFAGSKKRSGSLANSSFKEYKNVYGFINDLYTQGLQILSIRNQNKDENL